MGRRRATFDLLPLGCGCSLHAVLGPVLPRLVGEELCMFPEVAAVVCSAEKTLPCGLAPRFLSHASSLALAHKYAAFGPAWDPHRCA